jgi:hypothetical protein
MSQRKIKPKATVKSTAREAEKYLAELQGINERLKGANNHLAQAHIATHEWVKKLEERLERVEIFCGIPTAEVLPVEPAADGVLGVPGVEVADVGESVGVQVQAVPGITAYVADSKKLLDDSTPLHAIPPVSEEDGQRQEQV